MDLFILWCCSVWKVSVKLVFIIIIFFVVVVVVVGLTTFTNYHRIIKILYRYVNGHAKKHAEMNAGHCMCLDQGLTVYW